MPPKNFYNLPPSWNPGFEIPQSVMDEPVARGAFVTSQLPRGTISQVPHDLDESYDPHFDVPDYIKKESYGQGSATTMWLPRGTIFGPVAEFGMAPGRTILDRPDAGLSDDGLEDLDDGVSAPTRDPIAAYGQDAASWLMHSIQRVPPAHRAAALRAVFDAIDPGLSGAVAKQAQTLKKRGMAAKPALQQAIATSMSNGMLKEVVDVGKRARKGKPPIATRGHLALGAVPGAVPRAQRAAFQSLGWGLSDLNPINLVKDVGGAVASGTSAVANAVAGAIKTGAVATGSGIATAVTATGGAIKDAALATGGFVKDAVNVVGDLACDAVSSGVGKLAATAAGGPAGGAGAVLVAGQCGAGGGAPVVPRPPPRGLPAWVGPAVLGVGILGVGALIMRRK